MASAGSPYLTSNCFISSALSGVLIYSITLYFIPDSLSIPNTLLLVLQLDL
jgi:hypothetical protein